MGQIPNREMLEQVGECATSILERCETLHMVFPAETVISGLASVFLGLALEHAGKELTKQLMQSAVDQIDRIAVAKEKGDSIYIGELR